MAPIPKDRQDYIAHQTVDIESGGFGSLKYYPLEVCKRSTDVVKLGHYYFQQVSVAGKIQKFHYLLGGIPQVE